MRAIVGIRALLAAGVAAASCTAGGSPGGADLLTSIDIAAGPSSVLSAVVTVRSAVPVRVSVVARGGGDQVTTPSTDDLDTRHEVPLVGMRAETTHTVTVRAVDRSGKQDTRQVGELTTGALPDDLPALDVDSDPTRMARGITLLNLTPWGEDRSGPGGYVVAVDEEGEVVWYYASDQGITDVSPTARGTLLVSVGDVGIREVDVLGNTVREFGTRVATEYVQRDLNGVLLTTEDTVPIGIDSAHHELYELANGNLITLSTEPLVLDQSDATGLCPENPSTSIVADVVVELTPAGEVVREWHLTDVFDPTSRPGTEMCQQAIMLAPPSWFYPDRTQIRDWTHANAAVVMADNILLVSLRHLDAVVALRYDDDDEGQAGELLWELGPTGTLDLVGNGAWSYHQHAPEPDDDGTILLYDNGNRRPGTVSGGGTEPNYSRAVLYRVDSAAGTVRQLWEHRLESADGTPVYAPFLGDTDRLRNGNVLVTHGGASDQNNVLYARLVEVVPDGASGGDVVFDLTVGDGTDGGWTVYRAERVPTLYFTGHDLA